MSAAICLLALSACATHPTQPVSDFNFMDLDVFDTTLQQSMTAGSQDIKVTVMGDLTVNKIPDRLGKWLSVVAENGQLDYQPKTKSIELLALLPTIYEYARETLKYLPARSYDATVYYQQSTGKIDQIVFHKKQNN